MVEVTRVLVLELVVGGALLSVIVIVGSIGVCVVDRHLGVSWVPHTCGKAARYHNW